MMDQQLGIQTEESILERIPEKYSMLVFANISNIIAKQNMYRKPSAFSGSQHEDLPPSANLRENKYEHVRINWCHVILGVLAEHVCCLLPVFTKRADTSRCLNSL